MTKKIEQTLKNILECFEFGNLPKAITLSVFPSANIPSLSWSLLNRILVFFSATQDARGYRQWKCVKRYVKKGLKQSISLSPES